MPIKDALSTSSFFYVFFLLSDFFSNFNLFADGSNMTYTPSCVGDVQFYLSDGKPVALQELQEHFPVKLIMKVFQGRETFHLFQHRNLLSTRYSKNINLPENKFCHYITDGRHSSANANAVANLCLPHISGFVWLQSGIAAELIFDGSNLQLCTSNYSDSSFSSHSFNENNHEFENSRISRGRRYRRSAKQFPIRYLEFAIVHDYSQFQRWKTEDALHQRSIQLANLISGLYSPFNIRIALIGVEIWTKKDNFQITSDPDQTLNNFLHYRTARLMQYMANDAAQLMTTVTMTGGIVGKALKGPICSPSMSGAVVVDHMDRLLPVAVTMAHEMGHNFGCEHDNDSCSCPDKQCLMAAGTSGWMPPTHWSSCSVEMIEWSLSHGAQHCISESLPSKPLFESPQCGNGIVEKGESCDCGPVPELSSMCDNGCCNVTTCQLVEGAECGAGDCCDLKTCKLLQSGSICRYGSNDCDLPEWCDGRNAVCPTDFWKLDGSECRTFDEEKSYCFSGQCRSRNTQCQLLWGSSGRVSPDQCFDLNTKGSVYGNCGKSMGDQSYKACLRSNAMCGLLHCVHENEKTEYGHPSVVATAQTFLPQLNGETIICRSASLDLWPSPDPGLVPDGSICGDGKMCVNQSCIPVQQIIVGFKSCGDNCNGNGVCNNLGHCHCDWDFSPPFCIGKGSGGSVDSGPSPGSSRSNFSLLIGVLVFVLIVVPLILAAATISKRYWHKIKALKFHVAVPTASPQNILRNKTSSVSAVTPDNKHSPPPDPKPLSASSLRTSICRENPPEITPPLPPALPPPLFLNKQNVLKPPTNHHVHLSNCANQLSVISNEKSKFGGQHCEPNRIKVPSVFSSATLPRANNINSLSTDILQQQNNGAGENDSRDLKSTLTRQPSLRPQKPPPPRPKRPSEKDLNNIPAPIQPQRKAPKPPCASDSSKAIGHSSLYKRPEVDRNNAMPTANSTTENSKSGVGIASKTLPLPAKPKPISGGQPAALPSAALAAAHVRRSDSDNSSSSESGSKRPKLPPPPPPPDSHYYDVIPADSCAAKAVGIPFMDDSNTSGVKTALPNSKVGSLFDEMHQYMEKPTRVASLAAKFDPKRNIVSTRVVD